MFAVPDMIDMLPNKDEVLRQAGEALYYSQCFEGTVAFSLHIYRELRCEREPSWELTEEMIAELSQILSEGFSFRKVTLGQLLKELRNVVFIQPEADDALSKALDMRNFLIHRYFLSREWESVFGTGMSHDVTTLNEIIQQMKTAHEVMGTIVGSLQRKLDEARKKSWERGS
jgi:hypothetical protein